MLVGNKKNFLFYLIAASNNPDAQETGYITKHPKMCTRLLAWSWRELAWPVPRCVTTRRPRVHCSELLDGRKVGYNYLKSNMVHLHMLQAREANIFILFYFLKPLFIARLEVPLSNDILNIQEAFQMGVYIQIFDCPSYSLKWYQQYTLMEVKTNGFQPWWVYRLLKQKFGLWTTCACGWVEG